MLSLTILSFVYVSKTSSTLAARNQAEFAEKALSQVETFLNEMQDLSYRVMTNPALLNQFNRLQRDARVENYFDRNVLADIDYRSLLTTINGPKPAVWRISVYNQYGDYIRTGAVEDAAIRNQRLAGIDGRSRMLALGTTPDRMELRVDASDPWSDVYSSSYIRMTRPLMNIYSEDVYGLVEVQQDIRRLEKILRFQMLTGVSITVQSESGDVVLEIPGNAQDEAQIAVTRTSDTYGWSVTLRQSRLQMIAPYRPLLVMTGLGGVLVTALAVYLIVYIARRLAKPLVALREAVGEITYNNMPSTPAPAEGMDEVRELQIAFETMVGRIGESVKLEKEAMLQTLQSQMNPHFLYNVLTVIGAAGMEGNCDQVVKMCSDTCAVLRYTTAYERSVVTIGEDVENMRLYLELMKARYEDYFTYTIDIPSTLLTQPIPKMVLQPLAENCFSHAFHAIDPPYHIDVRGALLPDGAWQLSVADNGGGFEPEKQAELLEKVELYAKSLSENYKKLEIGGCGLVNTALRLRFHGTQPAVLSIEKNMPCGTIMVIRSAPHADQTNGTV